jgi:hypothetical protein
MLSQVAWLRAAQDPHFNNTASQNQAFGSCQSLPKAALTANSLCREQEKRTMRESVAEMGNFGRAAKAAFTNFQERKQ